VARVAGDVPKHHHLVHRSWLQCIANHLRGYWPGTLKAQHGALAKLRMGHAQKSGMGNTVQA
jgi:hypothetical protein